MSDYILINRNTELIISIISTTIGGILGILIGRFIIREYLFRYK